jgi:hypothetical protein
MEVLMSDSAQSRKAYLSDLHQKEWERLKPLVPMPKKEWTASQIQAPGDHQCHPVSDSHWLRLAFIAA